MRSLLNHQCRHLKRVLAIATFAPLLYSGVSILECRAADSSNTLNEGGDIYSLQTLIDFDCLDGATIDKTRKTVSLFGHRSHAGTLLRIAYFDYLSTALDSMDPAVSLLPATKGSVEKSVLQRCVDAIGYPLDKNRRLTRTAAWFLQQGGAAVTAGMNDWETLSAMFRATNDDDIAELTDRIQRYAVAKGGDATEAYLDICKYLGISAAVEDISNREKAGVLTHTEATDAFNTYYLHAVTQTMGLDGDHYVANYKKYRNAGVSLDLAMNKVSSEVQSAAPLYQRALTEVFTKKTALPAPPWITGEALKVNVSFKGVPATSWLARTLYESDLLLKQISYSTEIRNVVPDFQTLCEFFVKRGASDKMNGHFWLIMLEPGAFQLLESPDRSLVRFSQTPMKFIVHPVTFDSAGGINYIEDPLQAQTDTYVTKLSSEFDKLAMHFPTLYKLRECAKIVALARWLNQQGVHPALPNRGAMEWNPPTLIQGSIVVTEKVTLFVGGVRLSPEQHWNVSEDKNVATSGNTAPQIVDSSYENQADLRHRLSQEADVQKKLELEVRLAQVLREAGDSSSAANEMDKAVQLDPNRPMLLLLDAQAHYEDGDMQHAREMLEIYLRREPDNAAARGILEDIKGKLAMPSSVAHQWAQGGGRITPFDWNGRISKAAYTRDERAPELSDIKIEAFRSTTLPVPPSIPDALVLQPDIIALRMERQRLVRKYQEAAPEEALQIKKQVEAVDVQSKEKVNSYHLSWDERESSNGTSH